MVTGYIYQRDTLEVIAEVIGGQADIEAYADAEYDSETCGLTYSPAFGFSGGLVDTTGTDIVDLG